MGWSPPEDSGRRQSSTCTARSLSLKPTSSQIAVSCDDASFTSSASLSMVLPASLLAPLSSLFAEEGSSA